MISNRARRQGHDRFDWTDPVANGDHVVRVFIPDHVHALLEDYIEGSDLSVGEAIDLAVEAYLTAEAFRKRHKIY